MNVSLQLWMNDVHMAQDTSLVVPSWWETFFDPGAKHRNWPKKPVRCLALWLACAATEQLWVTLL